jgi:hypothetical protein
MSPAAGRGPHEIVWSATMSLDGFIAGPGDATGWVFDRSEPNPGRPALPGAQVTR